MVAFLGVWAYRKLMTNKQLCAHPECAEPGEFSAPKNPRNLRERQFFCKKHIVEFNKRWNGLEGFSSDEIFTMQDGAATWNRPTWAMGVNSHSAQAAQFQFNSADDLYNFFSARKKAETAKTDTKETTGASLPPDVREACAIFSLTPPFSAQLLKRTYLNLVKQHHPDIHKNNPEAEEMVKKINVAHQILADYVERQKQMAE